MGIIICILSVLLVGLSIYCYHLSTVKAVENKQIAYENEQNAILLEKLREQINSQRAREADLAQIILGQRQQEASLSAQISERQKSLDALAAQENQIQSRLQEYTGQQLILLTKIGEKNKTLDELLTQESELISEIEEKKTQDSELTTRIGEENKILSALAERKEQLTATTAYLQSQKELLDQNITNSQEVSRNAFCNYHEQLDEAYCNAEKEHDKLVQELIDQTNKKKQELLEEIETIQSELNKIKETREAAMEALRREELLKQEKDTYRVILTPEETEVCVMLEKIKPKLPDARILSMLIWQTFYQKKLKALTARVLGNKSVCGIYKITNIQNDMCYIGQARTIESRWAEHMKCGLGIDTPVGNKLYQAMRAIGPENFTFELLEECPAAQLNEKEKFYIDLYQSCTWGYNSNKGIG